ncbi:MAG: Gfo/Idh/MocA family oxidoreductase [Kiritimatiellae bacterium]|nr:Gfo/Idh/MocA family oxidoreductase [Kiritimatiellia bacterium]MDD5522113.1 Gfo/Idh/MocA family oxidoreductase [Kiritimatiellia bacterium]
MIKKPDISRRSFLRGSLLAAGATAFPAIISSSALGADGVVAPSNRIVMGAIGLGGMGNGNLGGFLGMKDVVVVGVCDVDKSHLDAAKKRVDDRYKNQDCRAYRDFRELIARGDLDAVSMATPDHWHALTAIACAKAGIDVYGEKPITHDLKEGRALCNAFKRHGRVWQTGSWQRSVDNFHRACELVRNGRIGKVHTCEVGLPTGSPVQPKPVEKVPEELDWDFWVGPSPLQPYCGISHWNWRWMLDFGGGQMMDWIGHHADIAHWGLDFDYTGPVEIEGTGDFPLDGPYNAPTSYKFTCKYVGGVNVIVANDKQQPMGMGTRWIGDKGWIHVDRGRTSSEPSELLKETIGPNETKLYYSRNHHANFIECVKSRKLTITPCEVSHRSASVGHLGQIAMVTGRKIKWNPEKEMIIGDAGAAGLLGRAYRAPWLLD